MKYYIYIFTVFALLLPSSLQAENHKWLISEIYSNADGTIQFVELVDDGDNEGHMLSQTTLSTAVSSFSFPNNLPTNIDTSNRRVLIATAGFMIIFTVLRI